MIDVSKLTAKEKRELAKSLLADANVGNELVSMAESRKEVLKAEAEKKLVSGAKFIPSLKLSGMDLKCPLPSWYHLKRRRNTFTMRMRELSLVRMYESVNLQHRRGLWKYFVGFLSLV